jgi:hypothetical protein
MSRTRASIAPGGTGRVRARGLTCEEGRVALKSVAADGALQKGKRLAASARAN